MKILTAFFIMIALLFSCESGNEEEIHYEEMDGLVQAQIAEMEGLIQFHPQDATEQSTIILNTEEEGNTSIYHYILENYRNDRSPMILNGVQTVVYTEEEGEEISRYYGSVATDIHILGGSISHYTFTKKWTVVYDEVEGKFLQDLEEGTICIDGDYYRYGDYKDFSVSYQALSEEQKELLLSLEFASTFSDLQSMEGITVSGEDKVIAAGSTTLELSTQHISYRDYYEYPDSPMFLNGEVRLEETIFQDQDFLIRRETLEKDFQVSHFPVQHFGLWMICTTTVEKSSNTVIRQRVAGSIVMDENIFRYEEIY